MTTPVKKSSENISSLDKAPLMGVEDTKKFMEYVNMPKTSTAITPNTKQRVTQMKQQAIESLKEKGYQGGKTRRRNKKRKQTKKRHNKQ